MPVGGRNAPPLCVGSVPDAAAQGAWLSGLRPMHDPGSARGGRSGFGRLDAHACVLTDRLTVAARRAEIPIESE
jgi:hypothetical protein